MSQLNESTLFNRMHEHNFGGLEADTVTFCERTPFLFSSRISVHSHSQKNRVYPPDPPLLHSNYKEHCIVYTWNEPTI
jgi:hypothetical protein